ncbi:MAG: pyridoxamine 5'-phosphate oxidase [Phycisphaerales bacterium]
MRNADQSDAPAVNQALPEPLPAEPLSIFRKWFDDAHRLAVQPNPNAMSLATIGEDGTPNVRIVLCKRLLGDGCLVFFTNYEGGKGRELRARPKAAVCFHWDGLDRQVRMQGYVTISPSEESDEYFASRPLMSRVAAWASSQSTPIDSRAALLAKLNDMERRFGVDLERDGARTGADSPKVPRPPNWGGYRFWPTRVELWVGSVGRLHDRAAWERRLEPATVDSADGYRAASEWACTRLQP